MLKLYYDPNDLVILASGTVDDNDDIEDDEDEDDDEFDDEDDN